MRNLVEAYACKIIAEKTDQLTHLWEEHPELTEQEITDVEERVQQLCDTLNALAEVHGYYEISKERDSNAY